MLFHILKKDPLLITTVIFLSFLAVIVKSVYPYITKEVVDSSTQTASQVEASSLVFSLGIAIVLQIVIDFFLSYLSSVWVQNMIAAMRQEVLGVFITKSIDAKDEIGQTIIVSDTEVIAGNTQNVILTWSNSVFSIIIFGFVSISLSPLLSMVMLLIVPFFWIVNYRLSRIARSRFALAQGSKDALLHAMADFLNGKIFIKIFHADSYASKQLRRLNVSLKQNNIRLNTLLIFIRDFLTLMTEIAPFLVLLIGIHQVLNRQLTVGSLIAIYTYTGLIFAPISDFVGTVALIQQSSAALERIREYVGDSKKEELFSPKSNGRLKEGIEVDQLSYVANEKQIIKNLSYRFQSNTLYLLTGENGSGKSTLSKIISNLMMPESGQIIKGMNERVVYLPSNNYVFETDVKSNLVMGIQNYSESELLSLANRLNLFENQLQLEDQINNTTNSLSTGQIQKIKIIRALLEHPSFLIMDEVLDNLDPQSRQTSLEIISERLVEMSVIIVTHHSHNDDYLGVEPTVLCLKTKNGSTILDKVECIHN